MFPFHPLVREWFERRFEAPTEAQTRGWPAIAGGRHTLISAPTGSGKTLAAFLICIDRLLRAALAGDLPDAAQVVYVSPLKALSNDVHRNLTVPLEEIAALARARSILMPEIRIALRTGDTPAQERRRRAQKPPHIWITTPESLYILLTSRSGRRGLEQVETLILDEIHAVAGGKRGSHLSLSVERLAALSRRPITRIGLSATQNPIEEVARLLTGAGGAGREGSPDCAIVETGRDRRLDLEIEIPNDELGPVASHELWDETVDRIADLVRAHGTTIVFVNTRRLVERTAHQLSRRIGAENVAAHHGSLSRRTRLLAEERLKKGELKVCVATASLELGIDVGGIDLVCQIGSPRQIGTLIQRVGRSGHWLGGTPKGRVFPLTRDELIECAALAAAIRRGELDRLRIPPWPLDILAQQIVAMAAVEDLDVEDLYDLVRRAWPYRELPRRRFDDILEVLSGGWTSRLGRRSAFLHYDRIHHRIRARRGARLAALTGGGAIPDNADYDVIADPDGTYVGSVNEDFAVESAGGDVFLLGNTSWRIRRIEKGKLRVEDARGQAPSIPFWLGEAPARTIELSLAVSRLRSGIEARLQDRESCIRWLGEEAGLGAEAADQAVRYIAEGKRLLGAVPVMNGIAAERFFDESGGIEIVIHSPWGGRINRAWGLALRERFRRRFGAELQASGTDDGVNLSLGPGQSFPLEEIFGFFDPGGIEEDLTRAVLASPIFTTRWRWTLTRSLALPRYSGGKRVPPPIQRMRAGDFLDAVLADRKREPDFPPDHPLLFETLRDCLTEALDAEGLRHVLERLKTGEIRFQARDMPVPSVFCSQILNAMPYAFLDDAPLQERRARAVIMRRALPEDVGELGRLDPEAVRSAAEDAWPAVRDADELDDTLVSLILFPESQMIRLAGEAGLWFEQLEREGRAFRLQSPLGGYLVAAERLGLVSRIEFLNGRILPGGETMEAAARRLEGIAMPEEEDTVLAVVASWTEVSGPFTAGAMAETLGFPLREVARALSRLESEGRILRGSFSAPDIADEYCDRRILARIHRATVAHLRREIEPVPASAFLRFLFSWQHVAPGTELEGDAGLLEVIEQLQGYETAAAAWEDEILPARVSDYDPALLDSLCLAGDIVWGRWTRRATQSAVPARRPGLTRTAPLGLGIRQDMAWLLDGKAPDEEALSVPARNVLAFLRRRGASFFSEITAGVRHLPAEVEEGLWQLVAAGLVTADSFAALRALVTRSERSSHRRRRPRRTREGRWSLLETAGPAPADRTPELCRQYLRRYGVLVRELAARESGAPPWRRLLPVLRRMEARGEIRGGRFVAGYVGEQFALPEAVDRLRALRDLEPECLFLRLSACDPLNLAGILTPGGRVAAVAGNRVVFRDGVPVAAVEGGEAKLLARVEPSQEKILQRMLDPRPLRQVKQM